MGWQRAPGYNWRALIEADLGHWKRVIGRRGGRDGRQGGALGFQSGEAGVDRRQYGDLGRQLDCGRRWLRHGHLGLIGHGSYRLLGRRIQGRERRSRDPVSAGCDGDLEQRQLADHALQPWPELWEPPVSAQQGPGLLTSADGTIEDQGQGRFRWDPPMNRLS